MVEVTVVLPVFNGEEYLREAMESILGQTHKNFEFLIVDDGSTDSSPGIIDSFRDDRIRLLKNSRRLKLSGALNRGIDEAKGRYIARMDADDIALPKRLEKQIAYLEQHPEIGVCGTAIEIFGNTKIRNDIFPASTEDIRSYALFDCPFCHPSVMMRKALFDAHELRYDGSYYPTEDYELWARAIELFPTVNLKEVLLRYRVHDKSMTGSDWDEMDKQAARTVEPILMRLGVEFTNEQLQFHRNIGRGRSSRLSSLDEIGEAEEWLLHLIEANREKHQYDDRALGKIAALVWYRLCMNSSYLGIEVFEKFRLSSLAKKQFGFEQFFTLFGSVMKNKFIFTRHS